MLARFAVVGGIGLASTIGALVEDIHQQVLASKMTALATDRVAAAASAEELVRFEDPSFHDRIEQASWAAQDYLRGAVLLVVTIATTVFGVLAVAGVLLTMVWWLVAFLVIAAAPAMHVALGRQRGDFALRVALLENRRGCRYLIQLLTGRDSAKEVRAFQLAEALRVRLAASYATAIDQEWRFQRRFVVREIAAQLLGAAILAAAVATMVALTETDQLSVASAITTLSALVLLSRRLQSAADLVKSMGGVLLSLDTLRDFLSTSQASPNVATPELFKRLSRAS
jgi:ATP-binding cassette subfamily B protein